MAFLWCSILLGQSILLPSENIEMAFKKQYPAKKPIWNIEYGTADDDIRFIAKFTEKNNTNAFAVYNSDATLTAYKVQILIEKLPQPARIYLTKNYLKGIKQILSVVADKNVTTYETEVVKDKKKYTIVFDKNGDFKNRIQFE